jgi:hypothetical protein
MMQAFAEFDEWTIVIFDNLLVLAHDHADMYSKLEKILRRAQHPKTSNLTILQMSYPWSKYLPNCLHPAHPPVVATPFPKGKGSKSGTRMER